MAIKINNSTIIDDSRNIVNSGIATLNYQGVAEVTIGSTSVGIGSTNQLTITPQVTQTAIGVGTAEILTLASNVGNQDIFSITNATGGITHFTATNSGNIGIGTTNPSQKLHVDGNFLVSSGNNEVLLASTTGTNALSILNQSSNPAFDVTGIGSVGIGTTQPSSTFQVVNADLELFSVSSGAGNLLEVGAGTTIVVVDTLGDLGIGTTNPTSRLFVVGDGYFSGIVTASSFSGNATNATTAGTATTATNIDISATSSGDTTAYVVLVGNNVTGGQQPFIDNGSLTYNASTNVLTAGGGFSGDGSALTDLNGSQITSGTISGDRGVTSGSTSSSFIEYNGTTKTAGQFDGGTTDPSSTTRLNYDGYLYATRFYGDGSQLTGTGGVSISTNTTNQNQFLTYAVSTGSTTGLGVTTSGLVFNPSSTSLGIGTTNPEAKLDVRGALNIGKFEGNGVYGSNSSVTITAETNQHNNVVYFNPVDASGTPAAGNRLSVGINTTLNYGLGGSNGSADLFFAGEDNSIFGAVYPKIKIGNPTYSNSDFYSLQAVYSGSGVGAYPAYGYVRNALYDATYSVALNGSFAFSVGERSSLDGSRASNFTSGNEAFVVILNGSTSLFHSKSKKLETTGYGVTITGGLNVSGVVTATSFTGNLTGTATTATNVTVTTSATNSAFKVPFANTTANTTGNYEFLQDSAATFTYNPSTDTLTVGTFSGSGASLTALSADNISSGTLAIARGGTNSTATPTNGGVSYGTGSAFAFTSAGTSGQILQSAGTAAPVWSSNLNLSGVVTATAYYGDGSQLTGIAAGGSGEFNTGITSSLQLTPLSYETSIYTFPSTTGKQYVIESINVANVDTSVGVGTTVNIIASIEDSSGEQTYIAYNVPIVNGGLIELLKNPIVAGPSDVIKMWVTNDAYAGVNNAADVYMNYSEYTSTEYVREYASTVSIATTDVTTVYTSSTYPSVIESIHLANRTDVGDYPVSVVITNGLTTTYLAKDLLIPRYATVDILDRPKRIETGATIGIKVEQTSTIDVIIAGKQITS